MVQYLTSFYRVIEPFTVETYKSNDTPTGQRYIGWCHIQVTEALCEKDDLKQNWK